MKPRRNEEAQAHIRLSSHRKRNNRLKGCVGGAASTISVSYLTLQGMKRVNASYRCVEQQPLTNENN
jgi:AMMECR1 domain-containing protein